MIPIVCRDLLISRHTKLKFSKVDWKTIQTVDVYNLFNKWIPWRLKWRLVVDKKVGKLLLVYITENESTHAFASIFLYISKL